MLDLDKEISNCHWTLKREVGSVDLDKLELEIVSLNRELKRNLIVILPEGLTKTFLLNDEPDVDDLPIRTGLYSSFDSFIEAYNPNVNDERHFKADMLKFSIKNGVSRVRLMRLGICSGGVTLCYDCEEAAKEIIEDYSTPAKVEKVDVNLTANELANVVLFMEFNNREEIDIYLKPWFANLSTSRNVCKDIGLNYISLVNVCEVTPPERAGIGIQLGNDLPNKMVGAINTYGSIVRNNMMKYIESIRTSVRLDLDKRVVDISWNGILEQVFELIDLSREVDVSGVSINEILEQLHDLPEATNPTKEYVIELLKTEEK